MPDRPRKSEDKHLHYLGTMPFGDHLEELRTRVILAMLGIVPIFIVALIFGREILALMIIPVQEALIKSGLPSVLLATGVGETFGTYIRIAVVATILVGSPWIVYNLWKFIAPGLYSSERRFAYLLAPMSFLLTVTGTVFLYVVMLPVILMFFIGFGSSIAAPVPETGPVPEGIVFPVAPVFEYDIEDPKQGQIWINRKLMQLRICAEVGTQTTDPVILGVPLSKEAGITQQYRISEYIKLFLSLALGFALGFQTPLVVLLLGWSGLVTREYLAKNRKYALLILSAASAFLTPADPLSMILLAVPLYLLYELGMLLMWALPAEKVARGIWSGSKEGADVGDE